MNAHALLTSQGWRGTGNSLHPTSNTIGLSKPLLVSQKQNNLGLGKKQHRTSDMWWMNAFDSSLKGLDTSQEGKVIQTVTSGGLDMVAKGGAKFVGNGGGLYASFVRGECLSGTLTPEESEPKDEEVPVTKKRKRDETEEERRIRKAAKRVSGTNELVTISTISSTEIDDTSEVSETKEERRARRAAKKLLKERERLLEQVVEEERVQISGESKTKNEQKAKKAAKQNEIPVEEDNSVKDVESKKERKERKRIKNLAGGLEDLPAEGSPEKAKKKKRRKE